MDADDDIGHGEVDFCEPPNGMTGLRACLRCGLVKCMDQFYTIGCENCPFLEMAERQDRVNECTTSDFEGVIALMKPEDSWLSKWEGLRKFYPGVYAVRLYGEPSQETREYLEEKGIACRAIPPEEEARR